MRSFNCGVLDASVKCFHGVNDMKSRKSLRIISVIVGIVSLFTVFGAVNVFAADDTTTTTTYEAVADAVERAAVQVPYDYVLVKAGSNTSVIKSDDIDSVEVKSEDKSKTYENKKKYAEGDEGYIVGGGYEYDAGKIIFYATGNDEDVYYVYTTVKGVDSAYETKVTVSGKPGVVEYDEELLTVEKLAEVQNKINEISSSDDSLELPFDEISELIKSTVLDKSVVAYTVRYATPGSTSFSSTSTKKGELADVSLSSDGVYRFYVTAKDGEGSEITVTDLEYKKGEKGLGYYVKDTEELKVPVFEYEYTAAQLISIESKIGSEKGRVNQRYQSATFTIENADDVYFFLEYSEDKETWVKAENGEQAKFDASLFTESQLYFTPLKKGYFRFKASAKGGKTGTETVLEKASDAISVQDEVEELKLVDERLKNFFKNNWLSMIFLGIALLCLVGIVVISLWKPKDDKKVENKDGDKTEEKTVEAEEVGEPETVEEVAEPAEEVEQTEETVEESTEGTTEPVETAEVEEVQEETSSETATETKND